MTGIPPTIIVIAGPNGAGKSTAAPRLLRDTLSIDHFVNADVIAQGLSGFDPESVAIEAARLMLMRLDELEKERRNFAFESTLAGRMTTRRIERYAAAGAFVTLNYLWLPTADLAIQRVQARVRAGGQGIPSDIVRRRFSRSLLHFEYLRQLSTLSWRLIDSSVTSAAPVIARRTRGRLIITDAARWSYIQNELRALRDEEGLVRETASGYDGQESEEEALANDAITRAFVLVQADVVRRHRLLGLPLIVWRNGRVESVSAQDVPIPGEE